MLLSRLTTLLSLLSGVWLPIGLGGPVLQGLPPHPWAATNQTQTLGRGPLASPMPSSPLSSWKAFLDLQKTRRMGTGRIQHGPEVDATLSLPLDLQEVIQKVCRAVPFTQVLSQQGCMAMRLRLHSHLCFGHCSSLYVPGVGPGSLVLCNSCVPTRRRWAPVFLWCQVGSPVSSAGKDIHSVG